MLKQTQDGARCRGRGLLHRRSQHAHVSGIWYHDSTGRLETAEIV